MGEQYYPALPVLIVDDEEDVLYSYKSLLRYNGINNIILCSDSREVRRIFSEQKISLTILDLFMPHVSGQELLSWIMENYPEIPVIIITAVNRIESAVECMKRGAFDYMIKPVEKSNVSVSVKRAIEIRELKHEFYALTRKMLSQELKHPEAFHDIITVDDSMKMIMKYSEALGISSRPVLITGESGVGKELIARAIYTVSQCRGSFVPVNVAGLDDIMFSDTLFGHVKGAFTGADAVRQGLIRNAEDGMLFLDEIGDLEPHSQVRLLRLLQEKEYSPLGSDTARSSNARIIAATNADIQTLVKEGTFRKDLYYRLSTHHIHVPPLRERMDDLPLLVTHFLNDSVKALHKSTLSVPPELLALLPTYHFPGNVRELQSMIHDAVTRQRSSTLSMAFFKEYIQKHATMTKPQIAVPSAVGKPISFGDRFPTLKEVEDFLIREALKKASGNQTIAAQLLGISQSTLSRRSKEK